ncbi:MAG: type II toxin-antitoxin system VapC family toxin [Anaerolineae bacterium]
MHLLDTDTLTHLYVGHARVIENLRAQADPDVGTTIVTRIELLRGRFDYVLKAATGGDVLRAQYLLYRTEELLAQINVVPFDEQAARRFDDMRTVAALRKIGRADLLIASIALAHDATLVTRNLRHFRQVPRLRLVNWVD